MHNREEKHSPVLIYAVLICAVYPQVDVVTIQEGF